MKKDKYIIQNVELGTVNPAFHSDASDNRGVVTNGNSTTNGKVVAGKETVQSPADDGIERQQWSNPVEFLMSCIAMSVGLGNVWRFPFTAYENGGGAFLIPYIIVLLIVGKPFYYMELAIGQFCSSGPVKVWEVVPALRGVGVGQMISVTAVATYYCSIMAITMFYFFASFSTELPWAKCDPSWVDCYDASANTSDLWENVTRRSAAEIYYTDVVLKVIPNIDDGVGAPEWRLSLCLLFSWTTICLVLIKGVESSGKAAYFLALFPYVVLITLLIRGCLLPGAVNGILYFITPQWEQLLNPAVWYAAVTQCFFSLSVGFGPLIMYSSYNSFKHNVHRDAIIVTTMDTFTSLLAGFTVFAILGNLAYEQGTDDISKVVKGGSGLAFISYPETIAKFDAVPQLFAVLFFLMLYTLGIGSAISLVGAVITVYCDQFPTHKRWIVTLFICLAGFFIGLVYVTPGGGYILDLVDHFSGNFIIYILAIIEIVGFIWIYGLDNFCRDLEFMLGLRPGIYWKLMWGIVTPIFLLCILFYRIVTLEPITYNGGQMYPNIAYGFGWALFVAGLIQVPFWFIFSYCKLKNMTVKEALKALFTPTKLWGPKSPKARQEWLEYCEEDANRRSTMDNKVVRTMQMVVNKVRRRPKTAPVSP